MDYVIFLLFRFKYAQLILRYHVKIRGQLDILIFDSADHERSSKMEIMTNSNSRN